MELLDKKKKLNFIELEENKMMIITIAIIMTLINLYFGFTSNDGFSKFCMFAAGGWFTTIMLKIFA